MGKTYRTGDAKFEKFVKNKTRKKVGTKLKNEIKLKKVKNILDDDE